MVTTLSFHGLSLLMSPNGAMHGQFPWMLKCRDITFYVSSGSWNSIGAVRFSSEFLWSSQGLMHAIALVQELVDGFFQDEMRLQVSAVDLCADVAGWQDIEKLNKTRDFVSRSRKRSVHAEPDWGYDAELVDHSYGLRETGFVFSRGGPVSLEIYHKTREITKSGKAWFEDLWRANGWSEDAEEGAHVWRVEVRYKREALHELSQEGEFWGVEDVYTLIDLLSVLWAYGVGHVGGGPDGLPDGWLRCVIPAPKDKKRAR
jgi:hypothetical protein